MTNITHEDREIKSFEREAWEKEYESFYRKQFEQKCEEYREQRNKVMQKNGIIQNLRDRITEISNSLNESKQENLELKRAVELLKETVHKYIKNR